MNTIPTPNQGCSAAALPVAEIARLLDGILLRLLALVRQRMHVFGPLFSLTCNRLNDIRQRLVRLLGHLAAGRMPRPHRPRPARPGCAPRPVRPTLPRRAQWLPQLVDYNGRSLALQIAHLIHQPGVADAIAASPGAARSLRALARLLAIELPAPLRLPPRPPRQRKPRPKPASPRLTRQGLLPTDRPLEPYVAAAARYWKRRDRKIT